MNIMFSDYRSQRDRPQCGAQLRGIFNLCAMTRNGDCVHRENSAHARACIYHYI